jgi:hypothetical protein
MRTLMIVCLSAALLPLWTRHSDVPKSSVAVREWPEPFLNMQVGQVTDLERRFAAGDRLGRFREDGREWLVRWVADATRRMHPAEECYRATGWRVSPRPAQVSPDPAGKQLRWGCFAAHRAKDDVEVCQTITDDAGQSWSDPGSWWWAAIFSRTAGPWLSVVRVTAMPIPAGRG